MAWIESHQSLLTHRKTLRLQAYLQEDRMKLIGHLHALWWWGLDNAKDDGYIGDITAKELSLAAEWTSIQPGKNNDRRAIRFRKGLLDARFIDEKPDGLYLHDWFEYAGKLNLKRVADRERKRGKSGGSSVEVAGNSSGVPAEVAGTNQPTNQPTDLTNHTNPVDMVCSDFAKFGKVTSGTAQAIEEDVGDFSLEWTQRAVKVAARSGFDEKPSWSYVHQILERWKQQGEPDDGRVKAPQRASGRGKRRTPDGPGTDDWARYAAGQD